MRIDGTESECPRCHRKFDAALRFECPFCGGLIPKGSKKCPTCQIDLHNFGGHEHESVEQKTDDILQELIQLESSLIKQEERRFCCPDCSWLLNGTESKCPKCGRPLVGENSLTCPICMAPIRKDAKECDRCGAILRAEKVTLVSVPSPVRPAAPSVPPVPAVVQPVKPDLTELESLLKCPHCGASAKIEATVCPICHWSLVDKKEPTPPRDVTASDAAATEALQTLKEIERQARGPRSRKLRSGKVTTVETKAQGLGRGLSNGLGQTNGTSMVNGRGRINGTGKVNGRVNGRVNGTGAVNGRSLVNGSGMSNGLRAKASSYTGKRNRMMLKWQFVAVLVAVVVVVPTVIYLENPNRREPITIDGDFSDWADAPKFGAHTQSGSSSLDIAEWATLESGETVYLYVRTAAAPMASGEPESFFLFIDSDGSASTGYRADSIGAEYMLRFDGWNGSVQSATLEERAPGADQYDWNSWQNAGSALATVKSTGVEAKGDLPVAPSAAARYVLISKDSAERTAVTYAAPSEGGLLIVELDPSAEATDGIIPSAPSVSVMSVRFTCQGSGGSVSAITPTLSGASLASQIQGFTLSPGGEQVVEIYVNTANAAAEQLVMANLLPSGISSEFAAVQVEGEPVNAYVQAAPQGIIIDGVFGDWAGRTTVDQDSTQSQDANIDVDSTGNYSTPQSSFFYVSVKGELGKGSCVPALVRKPSGNGGGHGVPMRETGEDILRVYIDSDMSPATGLGVVYESKVIGADRKIEIAGINGKIISASSWNYSGGNWIQSSVSVQSAKDYSQIEIGVDSILVNGRQDIDFIVETSSWRDEFDRACYNPSGTRALTARIAGNAHIESWVDGISTSPWATSMSYQRKIFWDGTNFWSFYFDGSNTIAKYSASGGATWTGTGAVFKTAGVNETSIWYDSANNVVYAVGDTSAASTSVYLQKGTVSPAAHTITWAATDSTLAASSNSLGGKNTFISRDTNGYLWVVSNNHSQIAPNRYQLTVFKSTSANSIASWSYSGQMLASAGTDASARGSVVPAGSGSNMWSIYATGGSVASRKYTGTWQATQTTIFTGSGQGTNTEIAPPSAVVDSKGIVHVVYGNSRKSGSLSIPSIEYAYNNTGATTFTTPIDLDQYLPSTVGDIYPTISLDTTTDNLYAFWLRTDASGTGVTITGRKSVSGTWSNVTIGGQTSYPKQYLTSIYSVAGPSNICWQWTQNTTATIHIMFDKIPEFDNVVLPIIFAMVLCVFFRSRARKKGPS